MQAEMARDAAVEELEKVREQAAADAQRMRDEAPSPSIDPMSPRGRLDVSIDEEGEASAGPASGNVSAAPHDDLLQVVVCQTCVSPRRHLPLAPIPRDWILESVL